MFYLSAPIKDETLKQELYSNMSFAALVVRTSDGQIVGCNNFAENFYGYSSDILKSINQTSKVIIETEPLDIMGEEASKFIHPRDIGVFYDLKNSNDIQVNKTILDITKDKRTISLDTNINKVELNGVTTFICVARDIRENIMLTNNLDYTKIYLQIYL